MPNNPLPDTALAELDRLQHGTTPRPWLYGKVWLDHVPNYMAVIALHNAYPALRKRLTDAEARLAEAERERDQLRAEVEDIRQQRDYWQEEAVEMRRYKEASESLLAGLREALEEAGDVVHACFCETEEIRGKVCHPSCIAINTAFTITPASAANRTDEETEAANGR